MREFGLIVPLVATCGCASAMFEVEPPVADADPAIRTERKIKVPTRLRLGWIRHQLAISFSGQEKKEITIKVGKNMVIGVETKRKLCGGDEVVKRLGEGLTDSLEFDPRGTSFTQPGEIADVTGLCIVCEIKIFETDIPAQHMWMPHSKKYKVLWEGAISEPVPEQK